MEMHDELWGHLDKHQTIAAGSPRHEGEQVLAAPARGQEAMVQMPRPGINGACQVAGRFNRAVVAFLAMGLGALVWLLCIPNPAYAADEQIDSFMINYDMQPSGVLTSKRNPKMIKLWQCHAPSSRRRAATIAFSPA